MDSFRKLFEFAVAKEEEAAAFYEFLASEANKEHIKNVFRQLAENEQAHKKIFEKIVKGGEKGKFREHEGGAGINISEYLVDVAFDANMDYQDALILAMKREEKSRDLYLDLSRKVADPKLAETLQGMSEEEATHKSRLEEIYEKEILTED